MSQQRALRDRTRSGVAKDDFSVLPTRSELQYYVQAMQSKRESQLHDPQTLYQAHGQLQVMSEEESLGEDERLLLHELAVMCWCHAKLAELKTPGRGKLTLVPAAQQHE